VKIHWTWRSVPELANLQPEERKQICRKHKFKMLRDPRYWIALIIFMIGFGGIISVSPYVRDRFFSDHVVWGSILFPTVACGLIGAIFGIIQSQIQIKVMLPYIREDLGLDKERE
jgi:predicted MFS family arabinose efflux permease